jgi:hypothetical protein
MSAALGALAFLVLGAIPLLPLLAKKLESSRRPAVHRFGRVLAYVTLWGALNASFAAMLGAFVVRGMEPREVGFLVAGLVLFQIPAVFVVGRVVDGQ